MNLIRKSADRGFFDHGWLKSHHSFSFAQYHDPKFMGWGNLRVINEDLIEPGMGFGTHGHRDMEIVTYVLSGALAHQDSMGNIETIPPGDVQRMSAGTGVRHSEFNHAKNQTTHFLQIWIMPDQASAPPSYEQITIDATRKRGDLALVAAPWHFSENLTSSNETCDDKDRFVKMHADAFIYAGYFDGNEQTKRDLNPNRKAYVHLVKGEVNVNGSVLLAGDALLIENESSITVKEGKDAEILFFDLAP